MRATSIAIVSLILVFFAAVFGFAAYQADQERTELYDQQQDIGLRFGCRGEYPIPAITDTGKAGCHKRDGCLLWGRPSCTGLTLQPGYLDAWDKLEATRDSLETRQIAFAVIAFVFGYLVVGWHLHSLIFALLLRFMLPKWALLVALVASVATLNAVGGVRAIVGLLKLPPRQAEAKARAA